jgi:hypothetical protein
MFAENFNKPSTWPDFGCSKSNKELIEVLTWHDG